jgi:hypothetical protein
MYHSSTALRVLGKGSAEDILDGKEAAGQDSELRYTAIFIVEEDM